MNVTAVIIITALIVLALVQRVRGQAAAALSAPILLSLGLTFLAEAVFVWWRAQSVSVDSVENVPPIGRYRGAVQPSGGPTIWPSVR